MADDVALADDPQAEHERSETDTVSPTGEGGEPRSGGTFGGLTPQEAAERSARVRRERAAQALANEEEQSRTFRQRLAVSLSRLSQRELDAAVRALAQSGRGSDIGTLARLADQAFGKPADAGQGEPDDGLPWTREERAAVWASLRGGVSLTFDGYDTDTSPGDTEEQDEE